MDVLLFLLLFFYIIIMISCEERKEKLNSMSKGERGKTLNVNI